MNIFIIIESLYINYVTVSGPLSDTIVLQLYQQLYYHSWLQFALKYFKIVLDINCLVNFI